ncbi:MAG: hypothetical protein JXA57_08190 [Armatimonadetes bacterium]|nr:hypothetical protein [Armatimonadota bacterium]
MTQPTPLSGLDWGKTHRKPLLLLSLQPQYWSPILAGTKRYEYRRSFRADAVQAYIYFSSPRKEVGAFVDFGTPIIGTPQQIADLAEREHPGSQQAMLDYLRGCERGFAVPILACEEIVPGISLRELRERFGFTAPQGYLVLNRHPALRDFIFAHDRKDRT